ncbi:DDE family transposase [Kribbella sp. VKM Ac-2527]|uniref:DDE family transposase n=1 Tax=Kribbella caucasensis TaxID=2512215 RepID=A0A4R6KAB6_9ACTN|nr:DDE family transposase [Kribbella sp. VKM Ac-2527]
MEKTTGFYPCVRVDAAGSGVVSRAGGLLLADAVWVSESGAELSRALAPWRKPLARHDPAKIVCDLAVALALGGDCLADIAGLRGAPDVFGLVASNPTVSRTIDALGADADRVIASGAMREPTVGRQAASAVRTWVAGPRSEQ